MDTMIKEINDNLRTIIDTMKSNLDNSINILDNIQVQMDKKVEEAKKYKVQVDSSKETIKKLEDENRNLELSLNELSDKYGKLNLVSLIETGNREIKSKINDNLKLINKEKEHISELTNRARTIKDLLINLKKDKTIKEEKLENSKVVYEYYNERINEVIDYAFNHSNNLADYKKEKKVVALEEEYVEEVKNVDLENTMVFDEIANIDENKNFKDEMTFISEQIDDGIKEDNNSMNKIEDIINSSLEDYIAIDKTIDDEIEENEVEETVVEDINVDNVFDTSFVTEEKEEVLENVVDKGIADLDSYNFVNPFEGKKDDVDNISLEEIVSNMENIDKNIKEEIVEPIVNLEEKEEEGFKDLNINATINELKEENLDIEDESVSRINKINDLFANFENNTDSLDIIEPVTVKGVEEKIDSAYMDIFGMPLDSEDLNKKDPTLTDIFGNPVSNEDLSNETKVSKKLEELFAETGIDFNKFREDEKNYLKQIYDEDKFTNIINTLKRNKINLDNIYNSFNIFGEISANELENLINKFISVGQSVEAIGLVLEKLPKVKKYNLDEAILSFGDYIKNIDITELIMKAKELYKNGGNN